MMPLSSEEKAALKGFFETYIVPLSVMGLLLWGMAKINDHPNVLATVTIICVLVAIPLLIAGCIYAVAWVISKGWHDGKS